MRLITLREECPYILIRVLSDHSVTNSFYRPARYKWPNTWTNPHETHFPLTSAVSDRLRWGLTKNKDEINVDLFHFDFYYDFTLILRLCIISSVLQDNHFIRCGNSTVKVVIYGGG